MKKTRLLFTESDLIRIIKESTIAAVNEILKEDGGMAGACSAAANGSGMMNGAANSQISSNAQYDVPAFGGKVMRKKKYSPKGNVANVEPALKRKDGKGGSISIPKRNK